MASGKHGDLFWVLVVGRVSVLALTAERCEKINTVMKIVSLFFKREQKKSLLEN